MAERDGRRPPAISHALLGWLARALLAPDAREALLGDLEEDFQERAAADARGARADYRREALRTAGALVLRPARPRRSTRPGDSLMHAFSNDLRLAARHLLRAPGFSLVVVLTLALGIGSVTAVFTLIDGVVLRPLPFEDPESLVHLFGYNLDSGNGRWTSSYPDFADFREQSESICSAPG